MGLTQGIFSTLKPGNHSPLPANPPGSSYPPVQYQLIDQFVKIFGGGFTSTRSNLSTCFEPLAQLYSEGFMLSQIQGVPMGAQPGGFAQMKLMFQVIGYRYLGEPVVRPGDIQLVNIASRMMMRCSFGMSSLSITWEADRLWNDIQKEVQKGARLLCFVHTGAAVAKSFIANAKSDYEVYAIFEMPRVPCAPRYIYHAFSTEVEYKHATSASTFATEFNWPQQFLVFLNAGWKLVDIAFECEHLFKNRSTAFFTSTKYKGTALWYFEKEISRASDNTPVWEGVVIRYIHETRVTNQKHKLFLVESCWNNLLGSMGQLGWEVAAIVATPEEPETGGKWTSRRNFVLLFFFQRRLQHAASQAPPAYEFAVMPSGFNIVGHTSQGASASASNLDQAEGGLKQPPMVNYGVF